MLREDIQAHMIQAMKSKDQVRLAAIRYLWSEIKNAEIDAKVELEDSAIHAIIKKEVKKRKDAIEQMKSSGRADMAIEEEEKLSVLQEFMMEELSREDVEGLVDQVISSGMVDFGSVIKQVMGLSGGKADGRLVSEIVKKKLS